MCGRALVRVNGRIYFQKLVKGAPKLFLAPEKYQVLGEQFEAHEIRPTDALWIHRVEEGEVVPELAFWTLVPPWVETPASVTLTKDGKQRLVAPPRTHFNSRRDTLLKSPGWRRLLQGHRCVIFLDAFFEWSDEEMLNGLPKMAGRYELSIGEPMAVAGIWFAPKHLEWSTVSIVTTEPNSLLASLPHHRMPAILHGEDIGDWLDPATPDPERLLLPTPDTMMKEQVVLAKDFASLLQV